MQTRSFLFATALVLSTATQADALGLQFGAYNWKQNFSGEVSSGLAGTMVDVEDDLGYSDENNNVYYVAIEHPIPILPNVRVQQTDMDLSATGFSSFVFEGYTYNGAVSSKIDLSHTDVTLYYEVLDNWISLDLGLTARVIQDGTVEITEVSSGRTESFDADGVLPLLYAAARIEVPFLDGLYLGADVNGIGAGDDSIIDYRAVVGYETSIGLGIEGGYRSFEIDYEDGEDQADLTIDGAYIAAFFHF